MASTVEKSATDDLMSPGEVSQILRVREQTLAVWRSARRYSLPYLKVGRKIFYRRSAVEKWLEDRSS